MKKILPVAVLIVVFFFYSCVKKKSPAVEPSHPMIQDQDHKIGEIAEIKKREIEEVTERE